MVSNQLLLQLLVTWLSQIGRPGSSDAAKGDTAKSHEQLDCKACQQDSPSCARKVQHCRQPLKVRVLCLVRTPWNLSEEH